MNLINKIKDFASEATGGSNIENWYITVERAEGVRDDDWFFKSEAFVKVEFGGKHFHTRAIKGNRSPDWNETFHFPLSQHEAGKDIHITLVDKDWGFDDPLGTATLSRGDLPPFVGEEKIFAVPVFRKEQINGIVHLRIKQVNDNQQPLSSTNQAYPSNLSSYPQQQQQMPQYNGLQQQQQPFAQTEYVQGGTGPQMNQPSSNLPYNQQPSNYNQQPSNYNQQPSNYGQQPSNYYGQQ